MSALEADLVPMLSYLQIAGPDILVDDYEQAYRDRQDSVHDISPDDAAADDPLPLADDCM